jgi:hypothetical protein
MKTGVRIWFMISVLLSMPVVILASEWVMLTSTDGKTIEAKLIASSPEEVEIEMRNGRRFTLPLTRFSLTSRQLIAENMSPKAPVDQEEPGGKLPASKLIPPFEFAGLDYDESVEEDFIFRMVGAKKGTLPRTAGKVMALMTPRLAGVREKFESPLRGGPSITPNAKKDHFRYTIYIVNDPQIYGQMVRQYAESIENRNSREFFLGTAPTLGQFTDLNHRFAVALDDGKTDMNGLVAHQVGFELVGLITGEPHLPLWLRMGSGYYAEQRLFDRCTVYYVDFAAYEENRYREDAAGGGVIEKREVLSHDKSWVPTLKKMTRKEQQVGLADMLAVSPATLSPEHSAYALALFAFCTSTPEHVEAFAKVLERVGERDDPTPEEFAGLFGYESVADFESAWSDFITSPKFR